MDNETIGLNSIAMGHSVSLIAGQTIIDNHTSYACGEGASKLDIELCRKANALDQLLADIKVGKVRVLRIEDFGAVKFLGPNKYEPLKPFLKD